jgi:phosphonate transport system substrate-binding protein
MKYFKKMEMKKICILFIGIFILFLWACNQKEEAKRIDLSIREEQVIKEEEDDVITYAYLPQYSHTVSYQRHHLLIEYLKKETGLNIKQIFPDTFDEHMKLVGQGKIDISFSNPFVYVKLAHRYGARAFARIIETYGKKYFRGQIISRTDNIQINTIQDCRNKRWIAVDPTSAGGYLFQLGCFIENGINNKDFSEISFAPGPGGKQEKVVLSVYAGEYDIGSIREGTLNIVSDKIDINEIRVIANTKWYPGWVYASRKGLDPQVVEKIKKAMTKLNFNDPKNKKILEAADFIGIIPSEDSEFNSIRELARLVGISLDE